MKLDRRGVLTVLLSGLVLGRFSADLAPQDFGDWAFQAVEVECSGASGRTWSNGQKGPMEAEVAWLDQAEAKVVEVRQDPASYNTPDTWTVMRDPERNEFCVTGTATLTGL